MIIELGRASTETKGNQFTATSHDAPASKKLDLDGKKCFSGSILQDVVPYSSRVISNN